MQNLSREMFRLKPIVCAVTFLVVNTLHAEEQVMQTDVANTDAQAVEKKSALETVQVTGIRAANSRTIAAKRDSMLTVDSTASDDIGKLPDFNVGDALKRVTGVSTMLYQGEPRFVVVRGLNANYNTTQIDGFTIATADVGGRQIYMELLPSNFVSRIDVTKSYLPSTDGGAIGGVVNMLSANAFSLPDGTFNVSGKLGANLMDDKYGGTTPVGEAQGVFAKRLGANNDVGIILTGSYWRRDIDVPQIEQGGTLNWYNPNGTRNATPYGGNGIAVPTERRWYNYDNSRDRVGFTARIDWQPEGPLSGHASSYYFKQSETSNRNTQNAQVQNSALVTNQTATSGTLSNVNQYVELAQLQFDRELYGANGELKYEFSPQLVGDLRGSVSRSTYTNPQQFDKFQQNGLSYNYNWANSLVSFSPLNPTNASNLSRYTLVSSIKENTADYAENVYDVQSNIKFNMDEADRGIGAATGVRLVSTKASTALSRTTYTNMPYTLANVASTDTTCGLNCTNPLIMIDQNKLASLLNQYISGATATVDVNGQNGGTYDYKEDVLAGYLQGQYRSDKWIVSGGLRLENTDFKSNGFTFTGSFLSSTTQQTYDNLLPSIMAVYETSASSKLRVGFSESVGRPRFDQVANHATLALGGTTTLTVGNSNLQPRESNNFDIGHEWYLDGGRGIFSIAAFYKEISNEIYTSGATQSIPVNGVNTNVLVLQAQNSTGLTKLSGVEIGLTKELDFITPLFSGFGVSANASFTHASFPITLRDGSSIKLDALPDQPKQIWNMALYYEKGPKHAKLAWNHLGQFWDDRFPNTTSVANFYANRYQQSTNTIDLQTSYDIDKRLSVSLDVLNITGEGIQDNYGKSQEYVQSAIKFSPTLLLGLSYKM